MIQNKYPFELSEKDLSLEIFLNDPDTAQLIKEKVQKVFANEV